MGWRGIAHGLRALLRRGDEERDVADEVSHWLEEAEADGVADGLSPEEARRSVRLAYGDPTTARENVLASGWEHAVETLASDVRYGARRLRRSAAFTLVAVSTLGLGIGAATAIFSAVRPALFDPLAYPHAERLVQIADRTADGSPQPITFGTFVELSARARALEVLAAFKPWQPTVTGNGDPERLEGQRVSAGYLPALGVSPALGRGFDAGDDRAGGPDVVVLSDGLWRRRFGADSAIVGRAVRLDDRPFTVVGVMPRGFENVPGHAAEVWALLQYDASLPRLDGREWGHHLEMLARLREGVPKDVAASELSEIAARPVSEIARPPWASLGLGLSVRPLREAVTAGARPLLLTLLGAAGMLLAIACLNVANLLIARGVRRRGELAMRTALGAARGRIARHLLVESLLLVGAGGGVGIVVASLGVGALVRLGAPSLPRMGAVAMNGGAYAFALGVTLLVGVVVGLVPAFAPARADVHGGLRGASARTAGSHLAIRRGLVVAEVALALVVLVGAGLMLRSMRRLFAVSPGFDPDQVVVMQVQTVGQRFDQDDDVTHRFFSRALDAVGSVPGVASADVTSQLPLSGDVSVYGVNAEDDFADEGDDRSAYRYAVSPGYFATLGIPLIRGRALDRGDVAGAPPAVVVDESYAKSAFPGRDPIGRRVHVGRTDLPWYTIVGVVGDVKQESLAAGEAHAVYVTPEQWYFADRALWLVVRTQGDARSALPALERAVWSVDADQPIVRALPLRELVGRSEAQRSFALALLEAFAVVALLLAGIGVYGVLAGSVGERTREIGVRAALGASRERIVRLVVGEGMALAGLGAVVGLAAAAGATGVVSALLFGVSRLDPLTYVAVVALLAGVTALASWAPAARAAAVDPVRTLRDE